MTVKVLFAICFACLFALALRCFALFHERMWVGEEHDARSYFFVGLGFLFFAGLSAWRLIALLGAM